VQRAHGKPQAWLPKPTQDSATKSCIFRTLARTASRISSSDRVGGFAAAAPCTPSPTADGSVVAAAAAGAAASARPSASINLNYWRETSHHGAQQRPKSRMERAEIH
jgi:hypothetical protein